MMFCCCVADEKVENSIALPPVIPEQDQQDLQASEKAFVKTTPAMQPEEAATRMLDIFTVILRQKDGPHGLQIDGTDPDCALVRAIKDGAVAEWNKITMENRVKVFDRIVEVNGTKGQAPDLVKALAADSESTSITIQRPSERQVKLQKPGEIGVILNYKKVGSAAPWISNINAGLLSQWNQERPEHAVQTHDRIVAVNGAKGAPEELMLKMKEATSTLDLSILHYAVDPPA
mmetsp:Transcript_118441/g.281169  ORF Transcript_118441/g.281169 Transcript_118441/m.281169 type:complete len:232 (-) Transcript_118441:175-870(-)